MIGYVSLQLSFVVGGKVVDVEMLRATCKLPTGRRTTPKEQLCPGTFTSTAVLWRAVARLKESMALGSARTLVGPRVVMAAMAVAGREVTAHFFGTRLSLATLQ